MQKLEVWNNVTSTIENTFAVCVLHYTISILGIKFPHDKTLIHAPCLHQNKQTTKKPNKVFISYLCLKSSVKF